MNKQFETVKATTTAQPLMGQNPQGMDFNPYAEDPRPNLFNIIKNIRDNKVRKIIKIPIDRVYESVVRCKAK
jgi:hypothetical protein